MEKIIITLRKSTTLLLLLFSTVIYSQVGINTITPDPNSILDVVSTDKGVLLPRVELISLTNPSPLSTHTKGMIVFNNGTFGSIVKEGYYYNDGTKWNIMGNQSSKLISFDTLDPNLIGAQFSPNEPQVLNNIYVSLNNGLYWKYDDVSGQYISYLPEASTEWYLNNSVIDAGANKNLSIYRKGSVGIGNLNAVDPSAMLEINSKNQGFLPPRMTKIERDNLTSPATGLVLYCSDCNNGDGCLVYNYGTASQPQWECLGAPKGSIVAIDCAGSAINGNYVKDTPNTVANTVTIKIDNNTFSSITNNFTGYLTLSGASAGLTISGPTPVQPVTIAAGASQTLTYTITGTPSISGPLTARFSGNGLTCEKTKIVLSSSVIPDCAGTFVYGMAPLKYLKSGTTYTAGTIRIPYTSTQTFAYPSQTVTLASGLTLTRTAGTFTAPSGYVEYTIGGTYLGSDCSTVTANITIYTDVSCSVVIGDGYSEYFNGTYVASSSGYSNSCPVTQSGMTDTNFNTGWASPNTSANQWIEISFPSMSIKQVALSGGAIPCWGSNSQYVSYNSNTAGLQLEYWNGSSWVNAGVAVPALSQTQLSYINLSCNAITTTKLRIRNNNAQWWGLGTFYPSGYWDAKIVPPTLNCSTATIALSPSNGLVNGQSYTGTVTVNYTSTVSSPFGLEVVSRSGITLTRNAGTMVNGSGSIVYSISGTYTGVSYNSQDFPISLFGAICNVTLGSPTKFLTGTYTATPGNTFATPACPGSQAGMTDTDYTTGWASPNSTTLNQWIQIDFGTTKAVKGVVVSGGPVSCWGVNAIYVSYWTNLAGIKFEYWNGSAWINFSSVANDLTQNSLTTYTLAAPVMTTRIRVTNSIAQWWGLGTFYPITY